MFSSCTSKLVRVVQISKTSEVHVRKMSTTFQELKSIYASAVSAVEPRRLIREAVSYDQRHLTVKGKTFELQGQCYVVGFGKAVLGMALEIQDILGQDLKQGICTVPEGIFQCFKGDPRYVVRDSRIEFIEGAKDNLPDIRAVEGAIKIKDLTKKLTEKDLLIVLISGGGSALLPLPQTGISLEEKLDLIKKLSKSGANILELNCVRKKLSQLKGGGLAALAYPAQVISLVISDIIGDPLDFIASSPTKFNTDKPHDALDIVRKYSLFDELPQTAKEALLKEDKQQKLNAVVNNEFNHVCNVIIGNNEKATQGALEKAEALGYNACVLSSSVQGHVSDLSKIYADLANGVCTRNSPENIRLFVSEIARRLGASESILSNIRSRDFITHTRFCLISGGEPTVIVKGTGKGGRNQQLALDFSLHVENIDDGKEVTFLSGGSDGIDGPTDAAGAIGTNDLVKKCLNENLDPVAYSEDNNAYEFFSKYNSGENLIKIGHTGTNVMDIQVMIVKPKL